MSFLERLDAIGRALPPWTWVGLIAVAAMGLGAALVARVWTQRRAVVSLEDRLQEAVRAVRQSEEAVTRAALAIERRGPVDTGTGELALPEPEREQLVRWIAAGQEMVGLVRSTVQDFERVQREGDAARRECERLRRELARLQDEHDHLLRQRKHLAQVLARFAGQLEAGPDRDSPRWPSGPPADGESGGETGAQPPRMPPQS